MAEKKYADKRYYADAKGKIVPEGSTDAAFLVVGAGGEITDEMVEKYGSGLRGGTRAEAEERVGIVVSGGRETGASFVPAEAADAAGATGEASTPAPAAPEKPVPTRRSTKKGASKKGK